MYVHRVYAKMYLCVYMHLYTSALVASHLPARVQPIWVWYWYFSNFVFVTVIEIIKFDHFWYSHSIRDIDKALKLLTDRLNIQYLWSVLAHQYIGLTLVLHALLLKIQGFFSATGQLSSHRGFWITHTCRQLFFQWDEDKAGSYRQKAPSLPILFPPYVNICR